MKLDTLYFSMNALPFQLTSYDRTFCFDTFPCMLVRREKSAFAAPKMLLSIGSEAGRVKVLDGARPSRCDWNR